MQRYFKNIKLLQKLRRKIVSSRDYCKESTNNKVSLSQNSISKEKVYKKVEILFWQKIEDLQRNVTRFVWHSGKKKRFSCLVKNG